MIHPSYSELIEAINTNNEDDDEALVLNSRYSLVLAASKRARQLIAGAEPLVPGAAGKKPLSVAIDELYKGKVKILPGQEEEEEIEALEYEAKVQAVFPNLRVGELFRGAVVKQDVRPRLGVHGDPAGARHF